MPAISLIVPVYRVEEYIERCIRSLFEQTLEDIEYIFVNDCSDDKSIDILYDVLSEYPKRREQVRVINMEQNRGQAAVVRAGIVEANGEYVIRCDSDDFVDRDMYRQMYEKAKTCEYDMVVCDMFEGNDDGWRMKKGKGSAESDMVSDLLSLSHGSLCNKLIKTSIAKKSSVKFPVENMCEDLALVIQYALLAKSIGYIQKPLYYYYRRSSSILGVREPEAMIDKNRQMVANFNIAIDAIERHGLSKKHKDAILHEKVWIKNQLLPVMPYQKCTRLWRKTYKDSNSKVMLSKMFTVKEKVAFYVTWLGLYPVFKHLKK